MKPRIPHPLRDPACNICDVIKYGYFHQLRLLICSGVQLECRDSCRRTPIMQCAFMEPETWGEGTARNLIENGVRLDSRDKYGRNVLHYACIFERLGLINILLKAIDFDLNQSDKAGNTALHYAAMSGNVAITQTISRFFQRYKIVPEKANKQGMPAMEVALRLGNTACARVIEQDRNSSVKCTHAGKLQHFDMIVSSSNNVKEAGPPPTVMSNGTHNLTVNYRPSPRPVSATFLTHRDSTSSLASLDERRSCLSYRSRSNHSGRGRYRNHQSPLVAMGIKREEEVVRCADEKDFRNTPDFVFKLLHLHFDLNEWNPMQNLDSTKRNNAWTDTGSTNQSQTIAIGSRPDWRHELKSLFKVYESQCSTSWRAVPKAPSIPTEEQERVDNEEEERGKKTRRQSNHSRNGLVGKEPAAPDLRRRPSNTRIRRLSSVHGPMGKVPAPTSSSTLDGHLDTSTESINSAIFLPNKRRGSEKEIFSSARAETTTNRAGLRRPSLDPSCASSPSSSPPPPLPSILTNEQIRASQRSRDKCSDVTSNVGNNNLNNKYINNNTTKEDNNNNNNNNDQYCCETTTTNNDNNNNNSKASIVLQPNNGFLNQSNQTVMKNENRKLAQRSSQDTVPMERSKGKMKDRVNDSDKRNPPIPIQITVQRVEENLSCGSANDRLHSDQTTQLDSSRLYVQNPYEEEDDDDLDENDDESV